MKISMCDEILIDSEGNEIPLQEKSFKQKMIGKIDDELIEYDKLLSYFLEKYGNLEIID